MADDPHATDPDRGRARCVPLHYDAEVFWRAWRESLRVDPDLSTRLRRTYGETPVRVVTADKKDAT